MNGRSAAGGRVLVHNDPSLDKQNSGCDC